MMILFIFSILFKEVFVLADEVKADSTPTITINDKNSSDVLPTYTTIDTKGKEASIKYSWGTVYYTSVSKNTSDDHLSEPQTHLNILYSCKNGSGKKKPTTRFDFCGYAQSKVDTQQRALIINELAKSPENKTKSAKDLNALYDSNYNDRIIDPAWNISENKQDTQTSLHITVRSKAGDIESCESITTVLKVPIDCP